MLARQLSGRLAVGLAASVATFEGQIGSDEWNKMVAGSKFKNKAFADFAKVAKGHIALQQHPGHSGWRNIKTGEEKIVRNTDTILQKAFSGIHVINTQLLQLIKQQGKFSMVDVYLDLARENIISSYDHTGAKLVDVGKPESILTAETIFL